MCNKRDLLTFTRWTLHLADNRLAMKDAEVRERMQFCRGTFLYCRSRYRSDEIWKDALISNILIRFAIIIVALLCDLRARSYRIIETRNYVRRKT